MLPLQDIVLRLTVAALLGALVGAERERTERGAGLRTHAVVGIGSCLFMLVSAFGFVGLDGAQHVPIDPTRIAAQVVSGIGFLCAGTIIVRRDNVHGLTTAAGIWASAAIGLAVGGGLFEMAIVSTVLILVVLAVVKPIERRLFGHGQVFALTLVIDKKTVALAALRTAVEATGLRVQRLDVHIGRAERDRVKMAVAGRTADRDTTIVESLRRVAGVHSVKLRSA
ncbi:MAG: MgtC/SapB family protein [Candidatus Binatia bacterium]